MDRQCNDQRKKDKMTNNDLQNTTQKTNDWATRTPHLPTSIEDICLMLVVELYIINKDMHRSDGILLFYNYIYKMT